MTIKKKRGDGGCYGAAAGASGGKWGEERPPWSAKSGEAEFRGKTSEALLGVKRRTRGRNWKKIRAEEGVKLVPVA